MCHFALAFGRKDESRKFRWGDVQLQQDKDGKELLVWLAERGTKTRHCPKKVIEGLSNQTFMPLRPKDVP